LFVDALILLAVYSGRSSRREDRQRLQHVSIGASFAESVKVVSAERRVCALCSRS